MKNSRTRSFYTLTALTLSISLTACNSSNVQQSQSGQCPQERTTEMAPAKTASMHNPLLANEVNIEAGEDLYQASASPLACVECHGKNGDGNGRMASMFQPSPRNFTCSENVSSLTDGQFYWIIKNGSIGTSMPAFDKLSDEQIWQLTLYLRTLEIKKSHEANSDQTGSTSTQTTL